MAMLIDRRYNPFRDFEDIDRSFFGDNSLAEFKTDIRDIGDAYVMECDLPGFRKEDIALNLHDKVLTIKAERHSDFENAEKKGSYLRCERSFGSYTRSFDVTGVDTTKVRAAYNNGVLAITLPKYVKPQPTAQTIDESFQSNIRGIYPCGEGAGYAGGIMSAAMDGLKVAEAIGRYAIESK